MILLERTPFFWSAPFSNKWLIDVVDTDFLIHDMTIPARTYGYTLLHSEISDIDRAAKVVHTARGAVDYDLLVIAGGVLMGFGGVLALGCSIGQGLSGVSTLSLGSIVALADIAAGARVALSLFPQPAPAGATT